MNQSEVIDLERRFIAQTYVRPDIVLARGEGVILWDTEGKRYLDMMAGIAVAALGHADRQWAEAVAQQALTLTHVSNLFHTGPQAYLARQLVESSFADRVFFCNSGSEANETALKFARKVAREKGHGSKTAIVAFSGSFHGRTMGALSVTARDKYRIPFEPLIPGVRFAHFNDLQSARAIIDDQTCAVIVEPVQGEGGVNAATPDFLQGLAELCRQVDALLIFDEIQCGLGRTGVLWAHEAYGVQPDIMTVAKPLAGGLPIGAALLRDEIASVFQPGDHGSTFAGGPLVCRAGQVVLERVNQPAMLHNVSENGYYLREALRAIDSPLIRDVRGRGLLVGVELSINAPPLIKLAREKGLLIINAGDNVIRICPPLIVERQHIDQAVAILGDCLAALEGEAA